MTTLPRCSCCAYTATKELVEKRFDEYESLQSRFKAAERQLEKLDTQISAIRADIARKAQTALKSELKEGRGNLLVLLDDFHVAVNEYEEIEADMGCPCCRGVPGAKGSYNDMIEAADVLRLVSVLLLLNSPFLALPVRVVSMITVLRQFFEGEALQTAQ